MKFQFERSTTMSYPMYPYIGGNRNAQMENPTYIGSGKLKNKVAIVTGGDSGIGWAVAIAFAKEGADLVIVYLDEHQDANETKQIISRLGRHCLPIAIDLRKEESCQYTGGIDD
jgi:hypothetical protein